MIETQEMKMKQKMGKSKVTVYTARKVRTMDPGRPEVEAVAVLDGKVLSTGTMESMEPWLSRYDVTVDDNHARIYRTPFTLLDACRIHGLAFRWSDRLQGMQVVPVEAKGCGPVTELSGILADQPALMGVLTHLYDCGIALISVKVQGSKFPTNFKCIEA